MLAKPIFIAMMLLRHLSDQTTLSPIPNLAIDRGTAQGKFLVVRSSGAARLLRVDPGPRHSTWFVMRDRNRFEEPFSHVSAPDSAITIETASSFRDIELGLLLNAQRTTSA